MHIQARRIFRLTIVPALALTVAYALHIPLPYIAPLFAFILTSIPGPPLNAKKLIVLLLVVLLTLGLGVLLIPFLLNFQVSAVLLVMVGLYLSSYLTVNLKKNLPGLFMAMGLTMISAAGTISYDLATAIIQSLMLGIIIAVLCQSLVYPFFPENEIAPKKEAKERNAKNTVPSNWIAIRSTLIVLPAYFVVLSNPGMYMPIMLKSVLLSQQSSTLGTKNAAKELIGSTFSGGVFAVLLWMFLGIWPNLWMFFLWMLLFNLYFACKIYRLISSRLSASFWLNTVITMLILIGPAVEDSNTGKDVYTASLIRLSLFIAISLYALAAVYLLEYVRSHKKKKSYAT